jgi:hypothetical protein
VPHRHFCIPNIWLLLCVAIRHRICVGTGARGNGAQMQEHLALSKCRDPALIDMSEADGDMKFNPRSSSLKEVDVRGRDTRRFQAGGVHQQTDRTTRGRAKRGSPNSTCVNNGDRSSGFFSVTTPMTTSRSGREPISASRVSVCFICKHWPVSDCVVKQGKGECGEVQYRDMSYAHTMARRKLVLDAEQATAH